MSAKKLRGVVFGSVVALSLGFGSVQALASPQTRAPKAERACNDASCDGACIARGFSGGVCNPGCTCF